MEERHVIVQGHLRILHVLSICTWLLTALLLYLSSWLPLFDSSPRVLIKNPSNRSFFDSLAHPLLRWDAFHFAHMAQEGYAYEHEWAFFPGASFIMRLVSRTVDYLRGSVGQPRVAELLSAGALASCFCGTTTTLYNLTLHHFGSPQIAFLTCLLSLLPSSPATLRFSAYNEPFFTYLSYRGEHWSTCRDTACMHSY